MHEFLHLFKLPINLYRFNLLVSLYMFERVNKLSMNFSRNQYSQRRNWRSRSCSKEGDIA